MDIEYEATFSNVDKDEVRGRLKKAGAKLVRPEFLQKRVPFHLPKEKRSEGSWLRVRDEGYKTTISLKVVDGDKIENQKEICIKINHIRAESAKSAVAEGLFLRRLHLSTKVDSILGGSKINNFDDAVELLEYIGCEAKSYKETKRELWELDDVEITIDEWPFLEPFVEVEGESEAAVKAVSEKAGFNYNEALFCTARNLYQMKYGIHPDETNPTDKIVFDMKNPFVK